MMPHTKALIEYLRDDGRKEEPEGNWEPAEDSPEYVQMYQMQLKKKRNQMLLKQMLNDAGYGDLSKMVNISKTRYQVDDDDEREY